jgi:uncharacterized protein (TIGR00290 family)
MKKAIFNWSSGKDSALALYKVKMENEFSVETLLTTVNKKYSRISMHGVREELLRKQAEMLNIPIDILEVPKTLTMEDYDNLMLKKMESLKKQDYTHSIFGDIFLEDLRKYRKDKLAQVGITGVFPIWKQNTDKIIREFLELGFQAITVSINAKLLDKSFVGRIIDETFLNDLPKGVDPCGENGEFHTFVFDGPIFTSPIQFEIGEKVYKKHEGNDGNEKWNTEFWYCDLLLK